MRIKSIGLILMVCLKTFVLAQSVISKDSTITLNGEDNQIVRTSVIDGDTVLQVDLNPITIMPPLTFSSKKEFNRYSKLVYNVKKVYPYSQLVSMQLAEIDANLSQYKTEKEKKKYIDEKEKELKQEFEGQIRSMTFTQGKILIKLIDRETGFTTFEIVKQLRGTLSAYFWQSIARIFSSNLKMEYDAKGEDIMIEDIVVRIENGEL